MFWNFEKFNLSIRHISLSRSNYSVSYTQLSPASILQTFWDDLACGKCIGQRKYFSHPPKGSQLHQRALLGNGACLQGRLYFLLQIKKLRLKGANNFSKVQGRGCQNKNSALFRHVLLPGQALLSPGTPPQYLFWDVLHTNHRAKNKLVIRAPLHSCSVLKSEVAVYLVDYSPQKYPTSYQTLCILLPNYPLFLSHFCQGPGFIPLTTARVQSFIVLSRFSIELELQHPSTFYSHYGH